MNLEEKFLNSAAAALPTGDLDEGSPNFRGPVPPAAQLEAPMGEIPLIPEKPLPANLISSGRAVEATVIGQQSPVNKPAADATTGAMPVTGRVFPEDTSSIQSIPRTQLQEMMGNIGSAIQTGAEYLDFAVIGLPDVGTLSLKDLTVGDLGKVMEAMSYGFAPTTGEGQTLRPTPEALDLLNAIPAFQAAGKVIKYGAKKLAPAAANMMEEGLRKSGMIMDIVPDGKSVAQQAAKSDIGFYSAVENAAINVQRKSGAGQSFLNDIMKGENVKAEEIKWMGLDDFLKGKKNVTKQEVQEYIANNKVDVQEVKLGEGLPNGWTVKQDPNMGIFTVFDKNGKIAGEGLNRNEAIKTATKDLGLSTTKFGQYTLAGGENYREILLTMPDKKTMPDVLNEQYSFNTLPDGRVQLLDEGRLVSTSKDMDGAWSEAKAIGAIDYGKDKAVKFKSSHFDQPNILAHLRVNDRVDADGKKMLLIEEVQSDWHQAGRDKGYKSANENKEIKLLEDEMTSNGEKIRSIMSEMMGLSKNSEEFKKLNNDRLALIEQQTILNDKGNALLDKQSYGVPDAPFKDTWYQLALKRALQYAAENGYERVGLTTGKQQAARFSLSNEVNTLAWRDAGGGVKRAVSLDMVNGENITLSVDNTGKVMGGNFEGKSLSSVIGKDLSNKIMSEDTGNLAGEGLNIGGEGMKKYYDEIYPKFLEKYGKKWNAKMGETGITTGRANVNGVPSMYPDKETVRYIDITPEMKAGVKKGQPLFAAAPIGAATGAATMQDERKK